MVETRLNHESRDGRKVEGHGVAVHVNHVHSTLVERKQSRGLAPIERLRDVLQQLIAHIRLVREWRIDKVQQNYRNAWRDSGAGEIRELIWIPGMRQMRVAGDLLEGRNLAP